MTKTCAITLYPLAQYWDLNLMNILSNMMYLDNYNDLVILVEMVIATSVLLVISMIMSTNWFHNFSHWIMLESVWTMTPVAVLLLLGMPSIEMVYSMEMSNLFSNLTLKIMGFQWYWSYSFPELSVQFDSYPKSEMELFRLGESNLLVLPIKTNIRFLISSGDVIHSWALPSIGLKMDAVPGRLNLLSSEIVYINKHIGQCSELCGNYHSWMPIYVESNSMKIFFQWMIMFCSLNGFVSPSL